VKVLGADINFESREKEKRNEAKTRNPVVARKDALKPIQFLLQY